MTQRLSSPALCVLLLLLTVLSTPSSAIPQQDPLRVANTVICAPCPGEPFGFRGQGMVLLNPNGNFYFYSLDRGEAKSSGIGIGAPLVTRAQRIGAIYTVGGDLTWAAPDGR